MKNIQIYVIIGLAVLLVAMFFLGGRDVVVGGTIHNVQESFDAGIAVNGVEVISDAGVFTDSSGVSVTCLAASTTTFVAGIATSCD